MYRCNAADIKMIVAAGEDVITKHIIDAMPDCPSVKKLVSVGPDIPEGFEDFIKVLRRLLLLLNRNILIRMKILH